MLDFVEEAQDEFDAGEVYAAVGAEKFDAPQGPDCFAVKVIAIPSGVGDGRNEAVLVIGQDQPGRCVGKVAGGFDGVNFVRFRLEKPDCADVVAIHLLHVA